MPLGAGSIYYRVARLTKASIISHNVPTVAARLLAHRLLPPGLEAGAEVGLGPGREHDDVRLVDVGVREGEGEGRGAADHLTLVVVLGAVARALELVLSLVPGHDAAKVGAHGVEAVVLDGAVILDDDVGGVTLRCWKGRGRMEGQRGCSRARKLNYFPPLEAVALIRVRVNSGPRSRGTYPRDARHERTRSRDARTRVRMRWHELADRGSFDAHAARAARASTPAPPRPERSICQLSYSKYAP